MINRRTSAVIVAALTASLSGAYAQQDFSKVEIKTTRLTDTLYMLEGEGGNIGVSTGADGVYLIDDQYAPLSEKILAAVKAISNKPIRFVINTHWHGDHVGGNENIGKTGATIMAHEAVRARMASGGVLAAFNMTVPPAAPAALPVITFKDGLTLHLNGENAKLLHVEPAHTDGDTLVHWPTANVIHTGDFFVSGRFPFIDMSSGGTLDGTIKAAGIVIGLANGQTKIIPGHGPLASKADVVKYRDMLVDARKRAAAAKSAGKTAEEFVAAKPYADLDELGQGFIKTGMFARMMFDAL